jgi:hypothetical protein
MYTHFLNLPSSPFAILFLPLFLAFILWTLAWKGWALWIAARNGHKWWFVALLVINTLAILEIIYIFAIGRPALKKTDKSS